MTAVSLDQQFAEAMGQLLGPDFPSQIGLAVSGGGDSMAMLALTQNWAREWGVAFSVVTVDHGLRPESAEEAGMVAAFCAEIGRPHTTLRWNWDGKGNVQDTARRARISLIDGWRGDICDVLMAHTADDVAETFLMRLARGSGVEGLSSMRPERRLPGGLRILRPCLKMRREDLRHYARVLQVPWADDPSNEDPKYGRARARQMLPILAEMGLSKTDLIATADRMQRASEALRARLVSVAGTIVTERAGCLFIDRSGFDEVERDTQLRLLAAALMWVSGAEYRPRAASLESLLDTLLSGGGGTLIGAQAECSGDAITIHREFAAVVGTECAPQDIWDGRWRLTGPEGDDLTIRALGEAVKDCPDWRETGLARTALLASPSVWRGNELIAAPVAGYGSDWAAQIVTPFISSLKSH